MPAIKAKIKFDIHFDLINVRFENFEKGSPRACKGLGKLLDCVPLSNFSIEEWKRYSHSKYV